MSTITLDQLLETPRHATRATSMPAPRPGRVPTARRSTVRLTRRGRIVVFVAGLLALLGIGLLVANGAGAALHPGAPEQTRTVVVAPGDTLWDIAAEVAHGGDTRAMITHIEQLNGLSGASLSAGETLRVPAN